MNHYAMQARVRDHNNRLKIFGGVPEEMSTRQIISETWRSGGGVIAKGTDRPTCVRRIVDKDIVFFGATSRHGALVD